MTNPNDWVSAELNSDGSKNLRRITEAEGF